MRRIFTNSLALAAALAFTGCLGSIPDPTGGQAPGTPTTQAPGTSQATSNQTANPSDPSAPSAPQGSLAVSPKAATGEIALNDSVDIPVTITPSDGMSGTVQFAVDGLPAGVTATFKPTSATIGSGPLTTTLTLKAADTASAGAANLSIKASAGGVSGNSAYALTLDNKLIVAIQNNHWIGSNYMVSPGEIIEFRDLDNGGHYVHADGQPNYIGIDHEGTNITNDANGVYTQKIMTSATSGQVEDIHCHAHPGQPAGSLEGIVSFTVK